MQAQYHPNACRRFQYRLGSHREVSCQSVSLVPSIKCLATSRSRYTGFAHLGATGREIRRDPSICWILDSHVQRVGLPAFASGSTALVALPDLRDTHSPSAGLPRCEKNYCPTRRRHFGPGSEDCSSTHSRLLTSSRSRPITYPSGMPLSYLSARYSFNCSSSSGDTRTVVVLFISTLHIHLMCVGPFKWKIPAGLHRFMGFFRYTLFSQYPGSNPINRDRNQFKN